MGVTDGSPMKKYCIVHRIVDPTHRCGRWANGSTRQWRRTRAAILARDGHRCTHPGCDELATEVHHVTDTELWSVCFAHNPRGG